jgi:hypothetical protein
MKILRDDDREFEGGELHGALRSEYSAPAEESYWAQLERRIMARIAREAKREWWSYFPEWSRVGLAAAALALAVAGVTAWQTQKAQERVAYQELLDTPSELPIIIETSGAEPNARRREATLRYLITH